MLSHFRAGADTDALATWLRERADDPATRGIVVSIDMLAYGGLIAARTTHDPIVAVLARLGVLHEIKASRPELPLFAVSLVTRASNSNSNVEEPEYWSDFGRRIHALGGDAHRSWEAETMAPEVEIPADVRRDYASRRLRNHMMNLAVIDLRAAGVLDYLAITADDTAAHSAGSVEQRWLTYWGLLDPAMSVPIYPGADETGAVLVARALCTIEGIEPRVRVVTADAPGMERIPPYENVPLSVSVPRQLGAAGGRIVEVDEPADLTLVVHTSDPARGDQFSRDEPGHDVDASAQTVRAVHDALERTPLVAVADLRYANGADPTLVEGLRDAGLLGRIAAYAGWNTAGNALGSTIALGLASVVAEHRGAADRDVVRAARTRRLLDDYAYQAVLRRRIGPALFGGRIGPIDADEVAGVEATLTDALQAELEALDADAGLRVASVTLPWSRSFEVDIAFDA